MAKGRSRFFPRRMQSDSPRPLPPPKRRITVAAREQFREELVNIARRIFLSEGYAAVTIRRITAEAGVTPMAFYWYFDCKDALLTVIWDEIIQEAAQFCRTHIEAVPESERTLAYCEAMLDFWLSHRDHFRFIFLGESPTVDMARLRRQLQDLPGIQQVYQDLATLLRPYTQRQAPAELASACLRTLLIYRLFGFLHSVIGMHQPDESLLATHREWVRNDLRENLARWQQAT
ncbi:MAG: hypothetical protein A3G29_00705 [Burkholderiales bacterium RIFCSPLOWO2_12_FULL_64_99]|nr:MAG: hypothetical protein A3E52_01570 [Burkholderiales bacterium RIFCSPHIGHO2_12_FULL_63_20]OGB67536.1 MAG: hypothetical protein A3G29_00705 [Burkholderiales bacterium RIFCSPLOWO2_12_FULL_64_99]